MVVLKCPHCKNNLPGAATDYLYGSPMQKCKKCKKEYHDIRYNEIAVVGMPNNELNPSKKETKGKILSGFLAILGGIVCFVLTYIIALLSGWIFYVFPIAGCVLVINGFSSLRKSTKSYRKKLRKKMEKERQQSELRMKDPAYVKRLVEVGYLSVNDYQKFCGQAIPDEAGQVE